MNEIGDGLWISDIDSVRTQATGRFDLVVSVCQDECADNVGCAHQHFSIADGEDAKERWGGSTDYRVFEDAARFVLRALERGDETLVHCHAGVNRSASVCIAALAVYRGVDFSDAFGAVREARPIINPNLLMSTYANRFIRERQ